MRTFFFVWNNQTAGANNYHLGHVDIEGTEIGRLDQAKILKWRSLKLSVIRTMIIHRKDIHD
jgi:hypothetical protein